MEFTPEERRRYIGGSDCAAACGQSQYKSKLELYYEKTGDLPPKQFSEEQLERMEIGHLFEDAIAKKFLNRRLKDGEPVEYYNSDSTTIHPLYHWMVAHVDRKGIDHLGKEFVLEIKTAEVYSGKFWQDDCPMEYFLQCLHYMIVENVEYCWLVVQIGFGKYKEYKILKEENINWIDYVIEAEKDFWHCVENKIVPEYTANSNDDLSIIYPIANEEQIVMSTEIESLAEKRESLKQQIKDLEKDLDTVENQIKAYLGDNKVALGINYKVTWSNVITNRFDSTNFKKDYPDLSKKYNKETQSRRFTVSRIGE